MTDKRQTNPPKRILLAGVFGPFSVDDEFGRKENKMELFHNQVTREQGLASFRFQHRSFGLYFLAENVKADITVLDFPSRERFVRELSNHYDAVGISFIAPNFVKAREMARLVRAYAPETEIILGGHGAAVEGVEERIECDHVVRGEGIAWLRAYVGQDPTEPIVHPALPSTERTRIFGVPVPGKAANLLVPGVGCVNACKFCATSHFFGRAYTPYLSTGKELFDACCHIADARGTDEFFVMDENFLKDKTRALELIQEMERHDRYFEFQVFSSAEAIMDFGLDNMERLGVTFVWIGVESASQESNYAKNRGIDPHHLVRKLRERGIIVLASGILCTEEHTPENIGVDIQFMVNLKADFVQFMLLTPLPVTALYEDQKRRGLLRDDLPLEEWHGQKELSFRHPHFPGNTAEQWLRHAFRKDYEGNGSSMLRVIETTLAAVRRLSGMRVQDECHTVREARFRRRLNEYSPMLAVIARHPVNRAERARALELEKEVAEFQPLDLAGRAKRLVVRALAQAWNLYLQVRGDVMQPATIRTRYPATARSGFVTETRLAPCVASPAQRTIANKRRVHVG